MPAPIVRAPALAATLFVLAAFMLAGADEAVAQDPGVTVVAILAHPDDEAVAAPILARYAREGADVYLVIATDGAAGGANAPVPTGPELAALRAQEARCATEALGIHPPILLGFADGKLGDFGADPSALYLLTVRIAEEIARLRPDAVITWGPDGGTGHADHRLVNAVVTQLARAGAPGMPERLFYMHFPVEVLRAMSPQGTEPPLLIPQARYASTHVPFSDVDLQAARLALECHRSQFPAAAVQYLFPIITQAWGGRIPLVPAFSTGGAGIDLFR
jgi:LmbE family N-acetylglucosaminyl deacetylase